MRSAKKLFSSFGHASPNVRSYCVALLSYTKVLNHSPDKNGITGAIWVSVKKPGEYAESAEIWRQQNIAGLLNRIRQHLGIAKLVSLDSVTGQAVVSWTNASTHSKNTSLLTFETHNHYFLSHVQALDENGFVVDEEKFTPKSFPGDIVYPRRTEKTYYYPKRKGGGVPSLHEVNTLRSAELNVPLKESEFDFGPYPRNALVSDSRFGKQFAYHQGLVQFTDTQLLQSTRDPDYLEKLELEAQQKEKDAARLPRVIISEVPRKRIGLVVTGVVALLMLVGLGGLLLRRFRQASVLTGGEKTG